MNPPRWMWIRAYWCPSYGEVILGLGPPAAKFSCHTSDKDLQVIEDAILALGRIAKWPNGAQAAVDAKVLDHVAELLESPGPGIRQNACWTVVQLAHHDSTAAVLSASNLSRQLVSLLW